MMMLHYLNFITRNFQAGLSWITILNKEENFRAAFDQFD
jgi:DNA-3-methyladenine glycosylase I